MSDLTDRLAEIEARYPRPDRLYTEAQIVAMGWRALDDVPALLAEVRRLQDADEADRLQDVERRLAVLLCNLTGGKLSKTDYPVELMEQEIEEYLAGHHESDLRDERDRLAAQVECVRELTYESDDGTRYGHDGHSPIAGYAECPGCWSDAIETVLGGGGDE